VQQSKSDEDAFKFPKRALSVAFAAGSIILFLFIAFVGFSATQLQFHVGDPSYSMDGERFVLSVPINVSNNGLFDLQNLQINTAVSEDGNDLFNSTTLVPNIAHQSETAFTHNLAVNLPDFLVDHQELLFSDSQLQAAENVSLVLAALIPVGLNFNITYDWGAPLSGFSASNFQFQILNLTAIMVSTDVAFNNHAVFPLDGNVTITVFGGATQLAVQTIQMNVNSGDSYSSTVQVVLPTTVPVSRVTMTIQTDLFSWEETIYG
jgi:hypothetical protein